MSELGAGRASASVWESLGLDVLALMTGHLSTQDSRTGGWLCKAW